jgi:hypothetical protein
LQGALAAVGASALGVVFAQTDAAPRVIELTARRFRYEPNEIALKAGERTCPTWESAWISLPGA